MDEYSCREAGETDFQEIADMFAKHDYGLQDAAWMEWKFMDNPCGRGRVFVVCDPAGAIKGMCGFVPHPFSGTGGRPITVMEAVDGYIAPEARGRNMFEKLMKCMLEAVDGPLLGFPNSFSERILFKCGWHVLSPVRLWCFPVLIGGLLGEKGLGFLAPLANLCSRVYTWFWLGRDRSDVAMRPVARFERDFPIDTDRIHGVRTADYLNWRFVDNPMSSYLTFEFVDGDEVVGYSILKLDGSSAEMYDFHATRAQRACFRKVVGYCRSRAITHVVFPAVGLRLWNMGLVRLVSHRNSIVYNAPEGPWMLTFADSDW